MDSGGLASHSFELEAEEKRMFTGAPAVITFRIPNEAALQEACSSPLLRLNILADRSPQQKIYWAKTRVVVILLLIFQFQLRWLSMDVTRLLAEYGSLVSVISILVLFVYLIDLHTIEIKCYKR